MKFILVISLCSFVNNQCLPPAEVKDEYDSWKDCAIAALEIAKEIIKAQENNLVNDNKLATKFMCNESKKI